MCKFCDNKFFQHWVCDDDAHQQLQTEVLEKVQQDQMTMKKAASETLCVMEKIILKQFLRTLKSDKKLAKIKSSLQDIAEVGALPQLILCNMF